MICRKIIIFALTVFAAVGISRAQQIAVGGSGSNVIGIFDLKESKQNKDLNLVKSDVEPKLLWSYALPEGSECNSLDVTKQGNLLFSYRSGVRMVDKKVKTLWDYPVQKGQEAQTAYLIDQKKVVVAICGTPATILELDAKSGEVLRKINFDAGHKDAHAQFRQVAKSKTGSYLVPLMWASKVVEIDTLGQKIGEWNVPSSPFSVKELCCNQLMVSTKDALVELDRRTSQMDTLVFEKIGQETLYFATEATRLDDGVTAVSNWQGYAPQGQSAWQIVWIDRNGKPFKTFAAPKTIKNVSCFKIIE